MLPVLLLPGAYARRAFQHSCAWLQQALPDFQAKYNLYALPYASRQQKGSY